MSHAPTGTGPDHPSSEHVPAAHPDVDAGGHDEHADSHDAMHLGGIGWGMWLAGIVGVAAGLAIVAAFVLATAPVS